jgi:hypothetical protein
MLNLIDAKMAVSLAIPRCRPLFVTAILAPSPFFLLHKTCRKLFFNKDLQLSLELHSIGTNVAPYILMKGT